MWGSTSDEWEEEDEMIGEGNCVDDVCNGMKSGSCWNKYKIRKTLYL